MAKMKRQSGSYLSYLVRVWSEERNGQVVWRASLESVQTGQRRNFPGLEELFAFLRRQIERATAQDAKD
jgi:hypothetical protein